jgi:ABC-2 type transport system ATP-binding protein
MPEPIIVIEQLSKTFKRAGFKSLDGMQFNVLKGEKLGIFGPNGAGKTTLISIMCGLLRADTGSVSYHLGGKASAVSRVLGQIGYVPQEYAFFQELTPQQNLEYFGALYGIPKQQLKEKIAYLLGILGLETVAKKKVQAFSGGMKRRVNLAIGMINDPLILFLDEPTVGVDVQSKMAIMQYLETLNSNGTTIIYTSHHLSEAEEFCDRILLIDHGKMIALDAVEHLLVEHGAKDLEDFFIRLTGTEYRDQ